MNSADKTMKLYNEQQLASIWNMNFKNAMIAKAPNTKNWLKYIDAYKGDYFKNANLPDYKSDMVSNYVFSVIETIRPIMLDNNPKFLSMPRHPEGMDYANDIQEAFLYEWDREMMMTKLCRELINTLTIGTAVFFTPWDNDDKNVKAIPVNAFCLFPDPLATCVEDAEYLIYANYKNVNRLKRLFPKHASRLHGGHINYSELVMDNNLNARIDNQVLVLEVWTRDYDTFIEHDDGTVELKYPKGRVLTVCPELGIVLSDKPNPYDDGEFPFTLVKDYDIPDKFWGEGEVAQLLSPQKHMNDLNNAIIDNAKTTANMPWIVDKNSGVPQGKITARPGLVIRKNPGSEVRREQPPSMPNYIVNAVETFKSDIEQVSGVYDSLKGSSTTGVYTAQGILALQEAGQSRIRLKVKLLEEALSKMARLWMSRMQQFWTEDRFVQVTRPDGTYDLKVFKVERLKYNYDIKVSAGSTMPVNRGAMLDLMLRLAQTPMPDGQPLVDRQAVVEYLPEEIKGALLKRMAGKQDNIAMIQQQVEQLGQQFQQYTQQNQQQDDQTMGTVEQITGAIEHVNQQILQLQQEYDKLVAEKQEQEKLDKLKQQSYNEGYIDAEKLYQPDQQSMMGNGSSMMGNDPMAIMKDPLKKGLEDQKGASSGMPDSVLSGLEGLSNDELAVVLQQHPDLAQLLK